MNRKTLMLMLAAGLSLTACFDDNDGDATAGARTVPQIAASQIAQATDEVSTPIVLNDLPISENGTDDSSSPVSLN